MISRGSSNASRHVRKAKSSSSDQSTQNASSELRGIDPETAHQQALTAASLAFERASERVITAQASKEFNLGKSAPLSSNPGNGPYLERKQSVRFTGPTAVPDRNRSITRRVAPGNIVSYGSPKGQQDRLQANRNYLSTQSETYSRASPSREEFVETRVSSVPTSYRKLRKARSMFSPRNTKPVIFTNGTPQKPFPTRRQALGSYSGDNHKHRIPDRRLRRSFSFLRGETDRLTSSTNPLRIESTYTLDVLRTIYPIS